METTMKRSDILANYAVDSRGVIRSPGKFEGEPLWVPALWEIALDGFADSDDGTTYGFTIPKADPLRKEFPELDQWLGRRRSVKLVQTDQGFVCAL